MLAQRITLLRMLIPSIRCERATLLTRKCSQFSFINKANHIYSEQLVNRSLIPKYASPLRLAYSNFGTSAPAKPTKQQPEISALLTAAEFGDLSTIEKILNKFDRKTLSTSTTWCVTQDNSRGDTPLHRAVRANQVDALNLLISQLHDLLPLENNQGQTVAHEAATKNVVKCLQVVIKAAPLLKDQNDGTNRQWTPLHHAAESGHLEAAECLVNNGANVYAKSNEAFAEQTPIHVAAFLGHLPLVKMFIERYPDLTWATDAQGNFPIHTACFGGEIEVVKYFHSRCGVDINVRGTGYMQRTCLHKAAVTGNIELVKWLVLKGADVYAKTGDVDNGDLAIHLAAGYGQSSVVKYFIKRYPDLKTATNNEGIYAIHRAASRNQIDVVAIFISVGGIDVNVRDEGPTRGTCLHATAMRGHLDLVKWLAENGADVFVKGNFDDFELMPIHLAAYYGHLPVVKYFVDYYADLMTVEDRNTPSPLYIARLSEERDASRVVKWLQNRVRD